MVRNDIDEIIKGSFPKVLCTLSTVSPFIVEYKKTGIVVRTARKHIYIDIDRFYDLLANVLSLKSFAFNRYKDEHKYVPYLLPVIKFVLGELGNNLDLYEPPRGGWKDCDRLLLDEAELDLNQFELLYENTIDKVALPPLQYNSNSIKKVKENAKIDVHYVTNRVKADDDRLFTGEKTDKLNYGKSTISIPNAHKSGNIERPFKKWIIEFKEDDNKHFVIKENNKLIKSDFYNSIDSISKKQSVMVFIHGYKVSFKNALYKSAQLKYDLNYDNPIVLFSWPSKGKFLSYNHDRENALSSAKHLKKFISNLSSLGMKEVIFIAHSMGTFCLSEALKDTKPNSQKFNRLVLAAADIDKTEFKDHYSKKILKKFKQVSLYVSSSDKALIGSHLLNQLDRVGDTRNGVTVVSGMDTVDMTDVDKNIFELNHSYVSENNRVLDDLHQFLINGIPANKRRLKKLFNHYKNIYWSIQS